MSQAAVPAPSTFAPPPDASPVVALRDVSIGFDGPPVLKDISLSVAPGGDPNFARTCGRGKERDAQGHHRPAAAIAG